MERPDCHFQQLDQQGRHQSTPAFRTVQISRPSPSTGSPHDDEDAVFPRGEGDVTVAPLSLSQLLSIRDHSLVHCTMYSTLHYHGYISRPLVLFNMTFLDKDLVSQLESTGPAPARSHKNEPDVSKDFSMSPSSCFPVNDNIFSMHTLHRNSGCTNAM